MPEVTGIDWFSLVQSVGIIFSILLAAYSLLKEAKSRKVSNYLQLIQFHRDVWKLTLEHPELCRVRKHGIDLLQDPPTELENQFLSFLFLHITCTFELEQSNGVSKIERLEYDINELLKFPLVRRFWEENKRYYNEAFIRFIDRAAKIA